ncbi:hypothetical protein SeMB42_g07875 [Synchytrium endobioticum]|uniref:Aminopeptidase P N-terminal domain-containing protein n=1 Tax=Synchytrium endobioticum TaxID=286115 RepID=A0A507BZL7_9FUNG|nr:hypothetical protein SeMB42_g07875 [Synchytrium endobioticum]TPX42572.1 hypothetical protein SeLEV6574_g05522 [Synchytrium endobioticum]
MATKNDWTPNNFYEPYIKEAARHREKVVKELLKQGAANEGAIYLVGNRSTWRKWSDVAQDFRQESFFYYVTGCEEPNYHVIIDIPTLETHLIIPRFEADYALWHGKPPTLAQAKEIYGADYCHYDDEMVALLCKVNGMVHVMDGEDVSALEGKAVVETKHLRWAMSEARVVKSELEIEMMRKAARISGNAHIACMKYVKPGKASEMQMHALFGYECFRHGCPHQAYSPICAGGCCASVLHYVRNDRDISPQPDSLILMDCGCEFHTYSSDITRTYPIGGKFTGEAKIVYEIVLQAQKAVLREIKAGVDWEDMHRLANRVICEGLQKCGILKGSTDELIENFVPVVFFPHGLGHLLGQEVHDVGGYPPGTVPIDEPGIRNLRMRRKLVPGMCVTVEPGVYFNVDMIEPALRDPQVGRFIDRDVLDRFRGVGGVRIEDDLVITEDGYESLSCWIAKEIEDIEAVMAKDDLCASKREK